MPAIETGRICIKTTGRNAGQKVTIIEVGQDNFVKIANKSGILEKCNIRHLFPTKEKTNISEIKTKDKKIKETKPKQKTKRNLKQKKEKKSPKESSTKEKEGEQ